MAHILKSRVAETSTTTGTGEFTLTGALTGHQAFSAVCSTSDTTEYVIVAVDATGAPTGDWEEGIGTYSSANTLTRTTVITSSNANAAVSFAAGSKVVLLTPVAHRIAGALETKVVMSANDINLRTGSAFTKTISGATTLTVSNIPTTGLVASFILDLTNGGSATITWWSGVKWSSGLAPTLTTSGRDVLGFFTHDGGTTWSGLFVGKDVK